MRISIMTATYNRAYILPKLYKSLVQNTKSFKDVEWLIMDDGSTDDTESLIKSYIKEKKVEIKYHKQKNGGKQNAINNLMPYVTGDIIIEVDSDDHLNNNVLSMVSKDYENLKDNVYGISYLRNQIGVNTNMDGLDNTIHTLYDIDFNYGKDFDRALTFKTSIRKHFRYELCDKEKFITEAYMYFQMDDATDGLLFKNKEIVTAEYRDDGYSKNIIETFKKYPKGYYKYFQYLINKPMHHILFKKRMYILKHFILFKTLTHQPGYKYVTGFTNKLLYILLVIPGMIKTKRMFK